MRKYALYIILSGALFASCSRSTIAHRKTNETMLSDSVTVREDAREQQDKQNRHSTERNTKTSEENRVIIKFDTEKPITKETGLPPVKEISFTGSTTNQAKVSTDSTTVKRRADKKEDLKTKKEVSPGIGLWQALLYICLIVFSYYLFDVIRGHWPKIKLLWRKILKQ